MDLLVWLLVESVMAFVLYSTGCFMLKALTFGRYQIEFKNFASFKASKNKDINLIFLLGLSFYVALIALIAFLNN